MKPLRKGHRNFWDNSEPHSERFQHPSDREFRNVTINQEDLDREYLFGLRTPCCEPDLYREYEFGLPGQANRRRTRDLDGEYKFGLPNRCCEQSSTSFRRSMFSSQSPLRTAQDRSPPCSGSSPSYDSRYERAGFPPSRKDEPTTRYELSSGIDLYEILYVDRNCSPDSIKRAYKYELFPLHVNSS